MVLSKEHQANEASRLLNDPVLMAAFDEIERRALDEFKALPIWASRRRFVSAQVKIQAIRDVKASLRSVIETGKGAAKRSAMGIPSR